MIKFRSILRALPLLSLCGLMQGCIGLAAFGKKTQVLDPPAIHSPADFENVWEYGGRTENIRSISATVLRTEWGLPSSITPASPECEYERWTYKFGPIWYGIGAMVVVPVPLVLPLSRKHVVFFLQDGRVVRTETSNTGSAGFIFAVLGPDGHGGGTAWNEFNDQVMRGVQPPASNTPANDSPRIIESRPSPDKPNVRSPRSGSGRLLEFDF